MCLCLRQLRSSSLEHVNLVKGQIQQRLITDVLFSTKKKEQIDQMRDYSLKANFFVFGKRQKAPSFCSGIMIRVTFLYMYYNGNRSSRPKSCRPKTESCCPKFLVMSPEKKVKSPKETNTKNIRISDCK